MSKKFVFLTSAISLFLIKMFSILDLTWFIIKPTNNNIL